MILCPGGNSTCMLAGPHDRNSVSQAGHCDHVHSVLDVGHERYEQEPDVSVKVKGYCHSPAAPISCGHELGECCRRLRDGKNECG